MSDLNGAAVAADEETEASDASADFRTREECQRLTGFGMRFVETLGEQGSVRREKSPAGRWWYSVTDLESYKARNPKPGQEPSPKSEYESELRTLVTGYKDLLTAANLSVKQAQLHERELFSSFSGPLKALVEGMQAQVNSLVERATAGDKARLDFIVATETMLRDNRTETAERERAEATRAMRGKMWEDIRTAAPHLWTQLQETLGIDPAKVEAIKAAEALRVKLDTSKVAALFVFLDETEKDLLCKAMGYDRAELEALARDSGATEAAGEPVAEAEVT